MPSVRILRVTVRRNTKKRNQMRTKDFIPMILCGAMLTACVDRDYDLMRLETDDIAIGDEGSTFSLPLAKIRIGLSEIRNGDTDIRTILEEARTWLPTELEDGCADIVRLQNDGAYLDELLAGLNNEMMASEDKMRAVSGLIWKNYRSRFSGLLAGSLATEEEFRYAFESSFRRDPEQRRILGAEIRGVAGEYLRNMEISGIHYEISGITLGDGVVDMLAGNLGSQESADPDNVLLLTGSIENSLPVSVELEPEFRPTSVGCKVVAEALGAKSEFPEMRLYEDDLRQIVKYLDIEIPVRLLKYYPAREIDESLSPVTIRLSLIKKGGLKLSF